MKGGGGGGGVGEQLVSGVACKRYHIKHFGTSRYYLKIKFELPRKLHII